MTTTLDALLASLYQRPAKGERRGDRLLIVADAAAEAGQELLECWCRLAALDTPEVSERNALATEVAAERRLWFEFGPHRWAVVVRFRARGCSGGESHLRLVRLTEGRRGRKQRLYDWTPRVGWTRDENSDPYNTPVELPAGLEAAVLAVLRRRLAELVQ